MADSVEQYSLGDLLAYLEDKRTAYELGITEALHYRELSLIDMAMGEEDERQNALDAAELGLRTHPKHLSPIARVVREQYDEPLTVASARRLRIDFAAGLCICLVEADRFRLADVVAAFAERPIVEEAWLTIGALARLWGVKANTLGKRAAKYRSTTDEHTCDWRRTDRKKATEPQYEYRATENLKRQICPKKRL